MSTYAFMHLDRWRGPLQTPQQKERAVLSSRIKENETSYYTTSKSLFTLKIQLKQPSTFILIQNDYTSSNPSMA